VTLAAGTASAQVPGLTLPQASPEASVSQTVGLTKMTIDYHRPAVNKRAVWGELVPFGEVWRAGANENTTITFSTPVKIDGKDVPAGTYGVHMIPTPKEWTVILSKMSVAWGSFSYDQKEDLLRVTVTPQQAPAFTERLAYTFDDPTDTSVTVTMRWEKLAVPLKVEVATPQVVMASVRGELRGLQRFNWQPWNQAARVWLRSGGDPAEAQAFVEKSIQMNENYQNLTTRAMLLEKKGDTKGAEAARAAAQKVATEADLNQYGYELMGQKKVDEAIAIFQKNVKAHPESWNAHDSLGEAYLTKGDKKQAAAAYGKALSLVKDPQQKKRIEVTLANLKK
jgi:hypothetical protein